MKIMVLTSCAICCCLILSGCADVQHVYGLVGEPAGFWKGLWHGFIVPFSFVCRLFRNDIAIYAVNNTGGWYDFGFILGASASIGGSSSTVSR